MRVPLPTGILRVMWFDERRWLKGRTTWIWINPELLRRLGKFLDVGVFGLQALDPEKMVNHALACATSLANTTRRMRQ